MRRSTFLWLAVAILAGVVGRLSVRPSLASEKPLQLGELVKATSLEIKDEWNGLGPPHCAFARLRRQGESFVYAVKAGGSCDAVGEGQPDPATPSKEKPCICAVDARCDCEIRQMPVAFHDGIVRAAVVEAFLRSVSQHGSDPDQTEHRGFWTDDYPAGHVAVWLPRSSKAVHLSFLDQTRRWRVDGRYLARENGCAPQWSGAFTPPHCRIDETYWALLKAIGSDRWPH